MRTVYSRISQHFVPITPTCFCILNSQGERPPEPRIGKYEFGPLLSNGCLCDWIRLLTNPPGGDAAGW